MKRVTGIGGVFFKCEKPSEMNAWYRKHLGIPAGQYGAHFEWRQKEDPEKPGLTAWSTFDKASDYFDPSQRPFMINYRVEDLVGLLDALKAEGVQQVGEMQTFEYGKFAWIMDPEGNKIELWEPIDQPLIDFAQQESGTGE